MNQLSSQVSFVYLRAFVVQGFKGIHHKRTGRFTKESKRPELGPGLTREF